MATKEEERLIIYLDEHVSYEREMLEFTFKEMHDTPPGLKWNIVFESFCIHARNLYNFLRHDGRKQTTFRADDYVPGRSTPNAFLLFNELDTFLFHMSTGRIEKNKVNLGDVQTLGKWLDEQWAIWVSSLKAPYAAKVDAKPVCAPLVFTNGASHATACTYFTAPNSRTTTASSSMRSSKFHE